MPAVSSGAQGSGPWWPVCSLRQGWWGREGVGALDHIVRWRQCRASPQFWNTQILISWVVSFYPVCAFSSSRPSYFPILLLHLLHPTRERCPPLCLQTERCAEGRRGQAGREGQVWLQRKQAREDKRWHISSYFGGFIQLTIFSGCPDFTEEKKE